MQTTPSFDILSRLLYRDALMLVIDKPAGIPVHKGTGGGDTLDQHFEALRFGLPQNPSLAHRLDKDTSGCLVLGRNRHGLQTLGKLFAGGKVRKTYWAIVSGAPPEAEGLIDLPLAKQSESGKRWWMKVDMQNGQQAQTRYRCLKQHAGLSWLEMQPLTGRTHQLRVHCAALGCPILGDKIYGPAAEPMPRLHLHAQSIEIPLYPKKPAIQVSAAPPQHMQQTLALLDADGQNLIL